MILVIGLLIKNCDIEMLSMISIFFNEPLGQFHEKKLRVKFRPAKFSLNFRRKFHNFKEEFTFNFVS